MSTSSSPSSVPEGLTPRTQKLLSETPPARWVVAEARARERARILEEVAEARAGGMSRRNALTSVAPHVHWSTYLNWWRKERSREGEPWERQLDLRKPTTPANRVPDDIRAAACLLRRVSPTMTCEDAQKNLIAQFGPERGRLSAASLKRIWKEAGLAQPRGGNRVAPSETVTRLSGGGGLALLGAAAAETGVIDRMAEAVVAHTAAVAAEAPQVEASEVDALRNERGQITAAYNRAVRGTEGRDPRWDSDAKKRERRALNTLVLAHSRPETVADKLLVLGASPLVTERRGFDGLEDPTGAWLSALGTTAYRAATLDKVLSELALVDAGEMMWTTHARQWQEVTAPWTAGEGAGWSQHVVYVDATQDPYWTRFYAASSKVSRVGRVMPCITRVAMMGGPGVPLAVETHAGHVSLKTALLPFLDRMQGMLGEGELGRLTIVDAEMSTIPLLRALASRPETWFVTVLKGAVAQAARRSDEQPWEPYRERDQIRSMRLTFGEADTAEALTLRGVEMVRKGSRNPTFTLFASNAPLEELCQEEVPTSYLSRWPHQEQRFRDSRNGIGLDRTHGYGGSRVTHVAVLTAQEKADKRVTRAEATLVKAAMVEERTRQQQQTASPEERRLSQGLLQAATRERRGAENKLKAARKEQARLATTPREIYVRDTTRDGIATCAKLSVLMLMEYTLHEYFQGLKMEARTFIESYVSVPVTIRESRHEVAYQLEANPRSPANTERLRAACAEITRREINRRGKRLRFEVVGGEAGS